MIGGFERRLGLRVSVLLVNTEGWESVISDD